MDFFGDRFFVRTSHGMEPIRHAERTLIKEGLQDRIMLRVQNFLVLPVVANSDLIALVRHSVGSQLSQQNDIRLLKPPIRLPEFDVKQCWHERYHADSGNQWLRNQVAELFMR